ncbi:MAG: hypothetical protein POELPBGB_00309 [Bacteroidia bacterium]|nr:hypothetical protein [Bacteroidia bacterium]
MASYELTGRLVEKYNEQKVTDSFRKREFVVETRENRNDRDFIESIKFQLIQDKCALLDNLNLNEDVKVTFNIRGRRYDKDGKVSYFTNLEAWRIESLNKGNSAPAQQPSSQPMEQVANTSAPDDDLPF